MCRVDTAIYGVTISTDSYRAILIYSDITYIKTLKVHAVCCTIPLYCIWEIKISHMQYVFSNIKLILDNLIDGFNY